MSQEKLIGTIYSEKEAMKDAVQDFAKNSGLTCQIKCKLGRKKPAKISKGKRITKTCQTSAILCPWKA
jgi:hypothetical protein